MNDKLRNLPKVDEFLNDSRVSAYKSEILPSRITEFVRQAINETRESVTRGETMAEDRGELFEIIIKKVLANLAFYNAEKLTRVINATGVIIHTNLGRAALSKEICGQALNIAAGYSNLEYSTITGKRRNRLEYVEKLLKDLTGAEAALVVNNNAAAVFLTLNTICSGKEIILSRGEIVEIGDSFRISEIIKSSGCIIREVGTTNRTYLSDYEEAIGECTGILSKIHTSNYKITGFTEETSACELVALGKKYNLPVFEDMGSGVLTDLRIYGLPYERTVQDAISDGVDIVTISGDKMLGASQAGIILGKKNYIDAMKKNQLLRCLRIDKLCLATIELVLSEYISGQNLVNYLPTFRYMSQSQAEVKKRALRLAKILSATTDYATFKTAEHMAQVGGGAMPSQNLPSYGVLVKTHEISDNKLEEFLRAVNRPAIITTLQKDGVMIDVRTVADEEFVEIKNAFKKLQENTMTTIEGI